MFARNCKCDRAVFKPPNTECSLCLSEKAKTKATAERKEAKQERDLAKAKERQIKPNTAIKPVSKKQAAINAEKSRIKKRIQEEKNICFTCESAKGETLSHIITAKNKAFELLPANLVLECVECHTCYEHHKQAYAHLYPAKWAMKLERAKTINETQYQKLKDKAL